MKNLFGIIFFVIMTSSYAYGARLSQNLQLVKEVGRCQLVLDDYERYSKKKYQILVDGKLDGKTFSSHSFNIIQAESFFSDYYVDRGICNDSFSPQKFKVIEESGRCQLGLDYEAKNKMEKYRIYVDGASDETNRKMSSYNLSTLQNTFYIDFVGRNICGAVPEMNRKYIVLEKQGPCELVFDPNSEKNNERYKILVRGRFERKYFSHSGFIDEARESFKRYFKDTNDLCFELPSDSEVSAIDQEVHSICKEYGQEQRMTLGNEISNMEKFVGFIGRSMPFTDSQSEKLDMKINPLLERLGDNFDLQKKGVQIKEECLIIYQSEIDKENNSHESEQGTVRARVVKN